MGPAGEMALFAKVVEANGFSAAAQQMNMSASAISKRIARLEDRLGARLLHRTTRRLGLTEVGAAYYERCRLILDEIEEAELAVTAAMTRPRGLLRLSVPTAFGQTQIAPLLPRFLEQYTEVRISVYAHDRDVDLINEGYDLAIRVARLRDSSMMARRLTSNRRLVCATQAYYTANGLPQRPSDLTEHNCLVNVAYSPQRVWSFKRGSRFYTVQIQGNLEITSPHALREAALRGLGVVLLPAYLVEEDLREGRLQAALSNYISEDPDVYLIYPYSRHLSPKVRVFVDFLAAHFRPGS